MRWALLLPAVACVAAAGCDRVFGIGDPYADAQHDDVPIDARADYRKSITIAQPAGSPLADFPVSILLDSDADLAAHAAGIADIGFIAGGAHLPCEIVRYDAASGALDAWVKVPTLPAAPTTTTIELVYGGNTTPCVPADAWPTAAVGVWHSELSIDRTVDSTSHAHDLAKVSGTSVPSAQAGIVGGALLYDGVDDSLCDPTDEDGSLAFGTSSFSYVVWINISSTNGPFDCPFGRGGNSSVAGSWSGRSNSACMIRS